ncbi:GNAT family N-acetyltransferase [Streptacidiphilus sp. 4-A2]|nr:GNAT family N-acetyltransferase [Streptacidiphilus sp. 4-A2]
MRSPPCWDGPMGTVQQGGTAFVVPVTVRDLTVQDIPSCTWSGSALHLEGLALQLERSAAGEVDYLALCTPVGLPVAIGGVDYQVHPGAGTLWQLAVLPALQSRGLGTLLVGSAEQRIRERGLRRAELGVEDSNPRARALYERLGYRPFDRRPASWDVQAAGSIERYHTMCTLMRKYLSEKND